jgi:ATP-binding cassette, subfamily B, bacterial CvaB/MchF/RaxB
MTKPVIKPADGDAIVGSHGNATKAAPMEAIRPKSGLHFRAARPLPVIRQSEASECALACLAMIVAYYGSPADQTFDGVFRCR